LLEELPVRTLDGRGAVASSGGRHAAVK